MTKITVQVKNMLLTSCDVSKLRRLTKITEDYRKFCASRVKIIIVPLRRDVFGDARILQFKKYVYALPENEVE
jgi:hypothetical protein